MTVGAERAGRARRITPPALADMLQTYKTTALLNTALELGVFDAIDQGAATIPDIAARLHADERGARLLLNALAAIGLLESDGTAFALPEGASDLLVRSRPGFVGDMRKVLASSWEWDALQRLPEAVLNGHAVVSEHAETPDFDYWKDFASYAGVVAQPMAGKVAQVLADWASPRPRLDILDVACGHGLYGFTLAKSQPRAQVWSLDWDSVLPIARANAERMGVAGRAHEIAGDMFEVPLGGPYDVVMITNVLHHFSEERGIELLKRAAPALKPDGKLVLVGFTVSDAPPIEDPAPHLFSVLMLVWTAQGEVHSTATYDRMLVAAGFKPAVAHAVPPLPLKVLVAERA